MTQEAVGQVVGGRSYPLAGRPRLPLYRYYPTGTNVMDDKRKMLKHFLAALAYRTQKALRGAPETFGDFRLKPGVRTPHELVRHMTGVIGYARTYMVGGQFRTEFMPTFSEEIERFHQTLESLAELLDNETEFVDTTPERMLQGQLSDAMTHAGQLAMLRGLHGTPVPGENFVKADIDASNLSSDQPDPVSPDEE